MTTNTTEAEPTPEQKARAFRNLLVGCGLGLLVTYLAGSVLDAETAANPLWTYGRVASVGLFGWIGWTVGIGRERVVSENIECLAIAIVMALILKYFLFEAYRIPSGSMQPTILGNEGAQIFDRVLVNKFAYLVGEPKRYDVIVFKYPLNRQQNYIKRCTGVGPERLTVQNGNVYSAPREGDGYGVSRIARKPADVRDSVLKTIFPSGNPEDTFSAMFTVQRGNLKQDGSTLEFAGETSFRFKKEGQSVLDRYLDGYDPSWGIRDDMVPDERERVGDLAIDCEVKPADGTREIRFDITSNSHVFSATLAIGDGARAKIEVRALAGGEPTALLVGDEVNTLEASSPLRAGRSLHVSVFHVDQEFVVEVDGDPLLRFAYQIDQPLPPSENEIRVSTLGNGMTIEDLRVRRDIQYLTVNGQASQSFDIPAGHLFAMGDNTQNSHDGRQWKAQIYRYTTPGDSRGFEIRRDSVQDSRRGIIDIYGEHYEVGPTSTPQFVGEDNTNFHYIPRELLLGKALAVFWPIVPHFRWKLIR